MTILRILSVKWISQSLSRSVSLSVSRSVNKSVSQSADQSVSRSVSQSLGQSVSQLISRPVGQSVGQSEGRSVSQSVDWPFGQSVSYPCKSIKHYSVTKPQAVFHCACLPDKACVPLTLSLVPPSQLVSCEIHSRRCFPWGTTAAAWQNPRTFTHEYVEMSSSRSL